MSALEVRLMRMGRAGWPEFNFKECAGRRVRAGQRLLSSSRHPGAGRKFMDEPRTGPGPGPSRALLRASMPSGRQFGIGWLGQRDGNPNSQTAAF